MTIQPPRRNRGAPRWTLSEILAVLKMDNIGLSKQNISAIIGRSREGINAKIFRGKYFARGRNKCGPVMSCLYAKPYDPKDKTEVDQPTFMRNLFLAFGTDDEQEAIDGLGVDAMNKYAEKLAEDYKEILKEILVRHNE